MNDDLKVLLGQLDGKMDMVLEGQRAQWAAHKDHEARITSVEKWQGKVIGGLTRASFLVGSLVEVLW